MCGEVGHGHGRGRLEAHIVREAHRAISGGHHVAGLPTIRHRRNDSIPHSEAVDLSPGGRDDAADLVPGRERVGRTWLIEPESHEQVREVDACEGDLDEDLPRTGCGRFEALDTDRIQSTCLGEHHPPRHGGHSGSSMEVLPLDGRRCIPGTRDWVISNPENTEPWYSPRRTSIWARSRITHLR